MAPQPASSREACHGGRGPDPANNTLDTPGPRRNDDSLSLLLLDTPALLPGVCTQAGGRANLLIIGSLQRPPCLTFCRPRGFHPVLYPNCPCSQLVFFCIHKNLKFSRVRFVSCHWRLTKSINIYGESRNNYCLIFFFVTQYQS